MTSTDITSPFDVDNPTAVAFLRWCHQDVLDELASDDPHSEYADCDDEERAKLAHYADGFSQAADLLAADADHPLGMVVFGFAFDEGWDDYQDHLADIETAAASVDAADA